MSAGRPLLARLLDNRVTRRMQPSLDRALIRYPAGIAGFQYLMNRLSPGGRSALFSQSGASVRATAAFGATRWRVQDGPAR